MFSLSQLTCPSLSHPTLQRGRCQLECCRHNRTVKHDHCMFPPWGQWSAFRVLSITWITQQIFFRRPMTKMFNYLQTDVHTYLDILWPLVLSENSFLEATLMRHNSDLIQVTHNINCSIGDHQYMCKVVQPLQMFGYFQRILIVLCGHHIFFNAPLRFL